MALETATYISGLNSSNPVGATDPKSQGDDHLRLIKTTLLNTFPNVTGAVTATQAELNILDGATLTVAELNILDGVTATAAELNALDGITSTVTELNKLDGVGTLYHTGNVATLEGDVSHDNLVGFVANEHINHANVDVIAGTGLTGGGAINASVTLNVIGGDGITANANDIEVDSTVVRTTGTQTIGGAKTFSSDITLSGTGAVDAGTRLNLTGATVSVGESGGFLGFFGSAGGDKVAVTGDRSSSGPTGALNILLNTLQTYGLITNSTIE